MKSLLSTALLITLGMFASVGGVWAAGSHATVVDYLAAPQAESQFSFHFQHQRFSDALVGDADYGYGADGTFQNRSLLNAYDAAIAYPVWSRGVNVDLGLNIRVLDGQLLGSGDEAYALRNFRAAIPMIYATALFDLPFEGLKAGFQGSYGGYDTGLLSDYRARIQYSLDNGLGIEGGWRRQQIRLDDSGQGDFIYEHNGAFLDFYMHF
ncbi:MAG TPA: hypothetical protein ENJ01_12445 [Gammaproteobacteria bacterium]|nr:hypothetical protein [Gammaproteobacteria bacterium]